MTASCLRDFLGLTGGHAYTIIGVQELTDPSTGELKEQLIKLRNPQGLDTFSGQWNREKWPADFKQKLDPQFLYLTVDEFKKAFESYDITYFHQNW